MDLVISICITLICSGYLFYYVSMKVHDFTNAIKMANDHTNSLHRHLNEGRKHERQTIEKELNNNIVSLQEEVIKNYDALDQAVEKKINRNHAIIKDMVSTNVSAIKKMENKYYDLEGRLNKAFQRIKQQ
jgi:type III secretory pathway component EscR